MPISSYQDPELAAQQILEQYADNDSIPVDSLRVAHNMGLEVFSADLGNDIYLVVADMANGVQFLLNKNAPPVQWRYAAAYGLGNYAFHYIVKEEIESIDVVARKSDGDINTSMQKYAHDFALALLMPNPEFVQEISQGQSNIAASARFGVSLMVWKSRKLMLNIQASS